jgi:hypothetical protein
MTCMFRRNIRPAARVLERIEPVWSLIDTNAVRDQLT